MKKNLLLLAGILALGATTFAAEIPSTPAPSTPQDTVDVITTVGDSERDDSDNLEELTLDLQEGTSMEFSGSYSNGIHWRNYEGPGRSDKEPNGNYSNVGNRLQYALGSGKLNFGNLGFSYSVNRYDYFDKDWDKTYALTDLGFGLDYKMGTFDALGKEWTFTPSVTFEYDKYDDYSSAYSDPTTESSEDQRLVTFSPKVTTNYLGFSTSVSPSVGYDDTTGTVGFALNASMSRKLNDQWSYGGYYYLDIKGTKNNKNNGGVDRYSNDLYTGTINDNESFAVSMEQYIYYSREIVSNLYFRNTFALEAYSMLQGEANNNAYVYAIPQIQYKGKVGNWDVTPYVSYFLGTNIGFEKNVSKNQLRAGVTFGTSF